jgi:hypothetical protein
MKANNGLKWAWVWNNTTRTKNIWGQLWAEMNMGWNNTACQNNIGQLWAKIKANNGPKFLNSTTKAKKWIWVNNWINNNQNNEPTKGQNNMGNFGLFFFLNENSATAISMVMRFARVLTIKDITKKKETKKKKNSQDHWIEHW